MPSHLAMAPVVGFVGLGAMGKGMALTLARKKFPLRVFDVRAEACADCVAAGATRAETPRACAEGAAVLVVSVVTDMQVRSVLFEGPGAALGGPTPFSGVVVVCATIPAAAAEEIAGKVASMGAKYLDAPMSGGSKKAGTGDLTFMISGAADALEAGGREVLEAMGKPFLVGAAPGLGSSMKMVNQLLAGVHIAAAAEAMALAARVGLDTRQVFEIITAAAGNSFMFENRVPHMLEDDPTPHSAIDIWPKDLGIVLDESKRLGFPCPMAGAALQQYLAAKGLGLGSQDDSMVVKVYEAITKAPVAQASAFKACSGGPLAKRARTVP